MFIYFFLNLELLVSRTSPLYTFYGYIRSALEMYSKLKNKLSHIFLTKIKPQGFSNKWRQ